MSGKTYHETVGACACGRGGVIYSYWEDDSPYGSIHAQNERYSIDCAVCVAAYVPCTEVDNPSPGRSVYLVERSEYDRVVAKNSATQAELERYTAHSLDLQTRKTRAEDDVVEQLLQLCSQSRSLAQKHKILGPILAISLDELEAVAKGKKVGTYLPKLVRKVGAELVLRRMGEEQGATALASLNAELGQLQRPAAAWIRPRAARPT